MSHWKCPVRCLGFNPQTISQPTPTPSKKSTRYSFFTCVLHMTKKWTPWVISKAGLSSEESREAGPLLILRMFWYFGLDLRWRIQASGKYQTDGEILALLLQSITWARLRVSLRALNAFHPVEMPLFPGTRLSIKPVSTRGKSSNAEVPTVRIWALNVKHCLNRIHSKPFTRSTLVTTLRNLCRPAAKILKPHQTKMHVCKAVSYLKVNIYGLLLNTLPVNNEHVLIPGTVRLVIPLRLQSGGWAFRKWLFNVKLSLRSDYRVQKNLHENKTKCE